MHLSMYSPTTGLKWGHIDTELYIVPVYMTFYRAKMNKSVSKPYPHGTTGAYGITVGI